MGPVLRSAAGFLRSGGKRLCATDSVSPDINTWQKPQIEPLKTNSDCEDGLSDNRKTRAYSPPRETLQAKGADETIKELEEFDKLDVKDKYRRILESNDDGSMIHRLSNAERDIVIKACFNELHEAITNDLQAAIQECRMVTQALHDGFRKDNCRETGTQGDRYSYSHFTYPEDDALNSNRKHTDEREEVLRGSLKRRKRKRIRFTHKKRHYLKYRKVPLLSKHCAAAAANSSENVIDEPKAGEQDLKRSVDGNKSDGVAKPTNDDRLVLTHDDELEKAETVNYEPYRFNWDQEMKDLDAEDEEIEDMFRDLYSMRQEGCEKVDLGKSPDAGSCEHKRIWGDEVGWYCELCGLVMQDIQQTFIPEIPQPTKWKVPSSHQQQSGGDNVLESEVDTLKGVSVEGSQGLRLNVRLHPFHDNVLKRHQKEGFQFLSRNVIGDESIKREPGGCILAHAPGTGKTLVTISFVHSFLTALPLGRVLIVAPKIMLKVWQREFDCWNVEMIPVYNLNECCQAETSTSTWEMEVENRKKSASWHLRMRRLKLIKEWLGKRSVLLISYNLFASLILAGLKDESSNGSLGPLRQAICQGLLAGPELVVLDEGHFPRTKRTKISQALLRIHTKRRIILSGTLFQNNFKELFNLLKLVSHDFLSRVPEFTSRLTVLEQNKRVQSSSRKWAIPGLTNAAEGEMNLTRRKQCEEQIFMEEIGCKLEEFVRGGGHLNEINNAMRMLRVLTSPIVHCYPGKILDELPGLMEYVVYLNLTSHQEKLQSDLKCKKGLEEKTRLAEIWVHPALLKPEDRLVPSNSSTPLLCEDPSKGVKTSFLICLLRLCKSLGERVLIFSQTLAPLALIGAMLTRIFGWEKGVDFLSLDGTLPSDERQRIIDHFNDEENRIKVLLASIAACKEGISLVGASRIVILDVLWNPSVVRQAVSRAFRLGQKRKVYVYRLVAADSREEIMLQASVQKDWFSRVLLDQSINLIEGGYRADRILRMDQVLGDSLLEKIVQDDKSKSINRIRRYNTRFGVN